jgi:hypothetical protein
MADFLQQKQREIAARLAELKPLIDEYERLQAADAALNGVLATSAPVRTTRRQSTHTRRGPGLPRGSGSRASAASATTSPRRPSSRAGQMRRGRPKGGGKRATEALTHITASQASQSLSLRPRWGSSRTTCTGLSPRSSKPARSSSKAEVGIPRTDRRHISRRRRRGCHAA